jgi:hypothetical protein
MYKLFKDLGIQDYITIGYLYFVLLGVVNIVIYYSSFNINIFDYIAITDILLAPINMLFLDYNLTLIIIVVIGILTYLLRFLFTGINILLEKIANKFDKPLMGIVYQPILVFIMLFSYVFLLLTEDMTQSVSERVKNKTYKLNTQLTLTDNSQKDVHVIATTSLYIFYVEKGESSVNIMPISGNIKSIQKN